MKKQARQLIGMLVALAVLAAGFTALRKYNEEQAAKPAEEEGIRLNDLEQEDIVGISYDYEGETYAFEKEEDTWYVAGDRTKNLTQYPLTTMASYLAPLTVQEVIGNVTDYEQYGLENPERHISFQTAEESFGIWVGDLNSMERAYYIRLDGDNNVYLVQSKFLTVFNYSLEDLIEEDETTVSENGVEEDEATVSENGVEEDEAAVSENGVEEDEAAVSGNGIEDGEDVSGN